MSERHLPKQCIRNFVIQSLCAQEKPTEIGRVLRNQQTYVVKLMFYCLKGQRRVLKRTTFEDKPLDQICTVVCLECVDII